MKFRFTKEQQNLIQLYQTKGNRSFFFGLILFLICVAFYYVHFHCTESPLIAINWTTWIVWAWMFISACNTTFMILGIVALLGMKGVEKHKATQLIVGLYAVKQNAFGMLFVNLCDIAFICLMSAKGWIVWAVAYLIMEIINQMFYYQINIKAPQHIGNLADEEIQDYLKWRKVHE